MCVDIVIVNWNAGHLLYECVESVIHYGGTSVTKIIVVDNNSSVDSLFSTIPIRAYFDTRSTIVSNTALSFLLTIVSTSQSPILDFLSTIPGRSSIDLLVSSLCLDRVPYLFLYVFFLLRHLYSFPPLSLLCLIYL